MATNDKKWWKWGRTPKPRPRPAHFAYSRWDGTQDRLWLDADDVFDKLTDDLIYHGDLLSALRRLMAQGFQDRDGRSVEGLRAMLERLRDRRRELIENNDLGGMFDDIAQALRDVVQTERDALTELSESAQEARSRDDARAVQEAKMTAVTKNAELDMMPPDLAGQFKALDTYEFESEEARRKFEDLSQRLREQLMQQFLNRVSSEVDRASETGEMDNLKDMLAELNKMLEQRARGEEPDFEGFMERHGHHFPENPRTLDELLEALARRMAAAQALLNSMTPEQREQLQALSDRMLSDLDLSWQLSELSQHLQQMFPSAGWQRSYDFSGIDPLDFGDAVDLLTELGEIDQLQNLLQSTTHPGALAEIDQDVVRRLLGDEAAQSLDEMADLAQRLEEQGLVENREGRLELTPRAIRKIGHEALRDLFSNLEADKIGRHALQRSGSGHERTDDTKPYEFGDPFNLDIARTVRNAITRGGAAVPVRLHPDDFEVERTEHQVRSATVVMLDLSLSMPMRENFLPAKKVAMALHSLISTQFPHDFLGMVAFSESAREFKPHKLPEVSWDYVYGTNMQHALMLSRRILNRQRGNKQIIMITDGEPTAHIADSGRPVFSYPPSPETIRRTLLEVSRCTRDGIRINTFMLDATSYLRDFIAHVTEMNGGRAFFTTTQDLGDCVLLDFVQHKRKLLRSR